MILVSLDEFGDFEELDSNNTPMGIAGLIFDDKGNNYEENTERERLKAYFKSVINTCGGSSAGYYYPETLHSNGTNNGLVANVKEELKNTIQEFMKDGTYHGNKLVRGVNLDGTFSCFGDRKGCYHLFAMLKSEDGKISLLGVNKSIFVNDDHGANRYYHMAGSLVNHVIFNNPLYISGGMPEIKLDIPTRSMPIVDGTHSAFVGDMKRLNYNHAPDDNPAVNKTWYKLMDAELYRALISQEMLNRGKTDIKIAGFYVGSISYDPSRADHKEFLYLSDVINSILSYKLNDGSCDNPDKWFLEIDRRLNIINPTNANLLFGYDEIDNDFLSALLSYEHNYIFEALSKIYDARRKKGVFAEYYKNNWFPVLENKIIDATPTDVFSKCVDELSNLLQINNLDQDKLVYIMTTFEKIADNLISQYRSAEFRNRLLYKLYSAGITSFCHIGDSTKAIEYYDKCKQYKYYAGIDMLLQTNNKLAVCLEDSFEWDRACEVAEESVLLQNELSKLRNELFGTNEQGLDEAKALSQLGRVQAEKRMTCAVESFKEALDKMERGSANYKITQSYLLHFYLDMNMRAEYISEVVDYFDGKEKTVDMYDYIAGLQESRDSNFSKEYAIYVLIRGLVYFNLSDVNRELWNRLKKIDEKFSNKGIKPSGHPWELIYKYLQMIAIKRGDEDSAARFRELKNKCLANSGPIITSLDMYGEAEVAEYCGDTEMRDKLTEDLVKYLKNKFDSMKLVSFSDMGDERYKELGNYFTFMYR